MSRRPRSCHWGWRGSVPGRLGPRGVVVEATGRPDTGSLPPGFSLPALGRRDTAEGPPCPESVPAGATRVLVRGGVSCLAHSRLGPPRPSGPWHTAGLSRCRLTSTWVRRGCESVLAGTAPSPLATARPAPPSSRRAQGGSDAPAPGTAPASPRTLWIKCLPPPESPSGARATHDTPCRAKGSPILVKGHPGTPGARGTGSAH